MVVGFLRSPKESPASIDPGLSADNSRYSVIDLEPFAELSERMR